MYGYGTIFALLSAISFGISNAFWKYASKDDSFSRMVFFRGLIASLIFGMIWIICYRMNISNEYLLQKDLQVAPILYTVLLCLFCSLGLIAYLQSLKFESVAISVALSNINIVSIITAVVVFDEYFHPGYIISFFLAAVGVWLITSFRKKIKIGWNNGVWYGLAAAVVWGFSYAMFRYPAQWLGAIPLAFLLEISVTISALCWTILEKKPILNQGKMFTSFQLINYCILAILLISGTLFFNLAIQRTDILFLNLTANISLITPLVLAWLWLKEKPTMIQWIGIGLILTSILLAQLLK